MKTLLKYLGNFFQDGDGSSSMTRLGFFIMICVAMWVATYQVLNTETHSFDVINITTLVTLACGLKLWQKGQELGSK